MRVLHLICAVLMLSGCAGVSPNSCTTDLSGFCHENSYRFDNLDGRDIRLNLVENVNMTEQAKDIPEEYQSKYPNVYAVTDWKHDKYDNRAYCIITISTPKGPQDKEWFMLMFHELRHCYEGPYHTLDYRPRVSRRNK